MKKGEKIGGFGNHGNVEISKGKPKRHPACCGEYPIVSTYTVETGMSDGSPS